MNIILNYNINIIQSIILNRAVYVMVCPKMDSLKSWFQEFAGKGSGRSRPAYSDK